MDASSLTVIVVEGVTDAAFLGLYLCDALGFKYEGSALKKGTHRIAVENYARANAASSGLVTKQGGDRVAVYIADGHNNFVSLFDEYVRLRMEDNVLPVRLVFLADADEGDLEVDLPKCLALSREDEFSEEKNFATLDSISFPGRKVRYKALLRHVPCDGCGCLETLLMDAIADKDKKLVEESKTFVDNLSSEASKYLGRKRLKHKAKLGVMFSLLKPDATFAELKEKFELIDLNCPQVQEQFAFLSYLKR